MELRSKKISKLTREIDNSYYIANYRDCPRFETLCKECPNYGARWGCPPFHDNPQPLLEQFNTAKLVLIKVDIEKECAESKSELVQAMTRLIQRTRKEFETELLEIEKHTNGRAALFTGLCPHCGNESCARRIGQPCRHPNLTRPALEALGFNIDRTVTDYFGIDLLWVEDKETPEYICLVGAVFLNYDS